MGDHVEKARKFNEEEAAWALAKSNAPILEEDEHKIVYLIDGKAVEVRKASGHEAVFPRHVRLDPREIGKGGTKAKQG